jgi:hypothetical protein
MTTRATASLPLALLAFILCCVPSCTGETEPGGSGGSTGSGGTGASGGRGGSAGASDCDLVECFRNVDCVAQCGGPVLKSGCCPCAAGTFDSIQCAGSGGSGGGVNCALVGCAMPPPCATGCTEVCGCCPCTDGTTNGNLVCTGGCWAPPCTVGADQSCNDNPALSSLHGRCQADGTCVCNGGFAMNPATGRCL